MNDGCRVCDFFTLRPLHNSDRPTKVTMAIPLSIITGTIGYLVLAAIAVGIVFGSRATGMLSKDNAAIANIVVGVATLSMWLFWLSAWMHQWHPLITPIYEG